MFKVLVEFPTPVGLWFPAAGFIESQLGWGWLRNGPFQSERVRKGEEPDKNNEDAEYGFHEKPPFKNDRQQPNHCSWLKPW
jgi:hypothetical protein